MGYAPPCNIPYGDCFQSWLLYFQFSTLLTDLGEQQKMVQMFGSLPPTWRPKASGFYLAQSWLLKSFVKWTTNGWPLYLFFHSFKRINKSKGTHTHNKDFRMVHILESKWFLPCVVVECLLGLFLFEKEWPILYLCTFSDQSKGNKNEIFVLPSPLQLVFL